MSYHNFSNHLVNGTNDYRVLYYTYPSDEQNHEDPRLTSPADDANNSRFSLIFDEMIENFNSNSKTSNKLCIHPQILKEAIMLLDEAAEDARTGPTKSFDHPGLVRKKWHNNHGDINIVEIVPVLKGLSCP